MAKKTFILDQGEFIGGAERFMLDFLTALDPKQIQRIHPLVLGGGCQDYQDLLQEGGNNIERQDFDYPPVRGGWLQKIGHIARLTLAAKKLKKTILREAGRRDFVIVSNTPRTHFVMYLARKVWGLGGNWITIIHDFSTPPGLMKQIASKADTVVANALPTRNWLHEFLTESNKKKIKIIENGVPLEQVPSSKASGEIRNILMMGRIDPKKGQMYALEAADLLLERNPELHFGFVGASVESDSRTMEYEKALHDFIADRKLENVSFQREVPNALERINEADLVLMLQTEGETFGRVAIEALACGKMVITFDETGPREILEQFLQYLSREKKIRIPREELIVEKNNAMSLAETIGAWADRGVEKAQELAPLAQEFVQKHYDLKETNKRLLNLICE